MSESISLRALEARTSITGAYSKAAGLYGNACPSCGDGGTVLESRGIESSIGVIRRRRKCQSCEQRFTTLEVREDDILELTRKTDLLAEILDQTNVSIDALASLKKRLET